MESRVENKGRKTKREAAHYWPTKVRYKGESHWILLTDTEVVRAAKRAKANPEDRPGLWERIRLVFGF
tara:strand:+ start:256 stop:459 length:204 start_codon:yes stop_codon:yes gene_type:complete